MNLRSVSAPIAPLWRSPVGEQRDDRLTECLLGEPVWVVELEDEPPEQQVTSGRVQVVAPWQPSSRSPDGYPGWLDARLLGTDPTTTRMIPAERSDPVTLARAFYGAPYLWGGLSRIGIDCSGLVHLVHRTLGVVVPRDAHDQADAATVVRLDDVLPGDLLFFARPGRPVHHVGIATATGAAPVLEMVHASETDGGVVEGALDDERLTTLVGAGRFGDVAVP